MSHNLFVLLRRSCKQFALLITKKTFAKNISKAKICLASENSLLELANLRRKEKVKMIRRACRVIDSVLRPR